MSLKVNAERPPWDSAIRIVEAYPAIGGTTVRNALGTGPGETAGRHVKLPNGVIRPEKSLDLAADGNIALTSKLFQLKIVLFESLSGIRVRTVGLRIRIATLPSVPWASRW